MMNARFQPKSRMTNTDGNVLMTQIRAEQKKYVSKPEPPFVNSHRHDYGSKKVFKENLFRTTCLFPVEEKEANRSISPIRTGKKTGYNLGPSTPKSKGKKKYVKQIEDYYNRQTLTPISRKQAYVSPIKSGRKRFDQSPTNQNRLSPNFSLKFQ